MLKFSLSAVAGILALVAVPAAGIGQSTPTILAARSAEHPDYTRLVLESDAFVDFSYYSVAEPRRIVLNFSDLEFAVQREVWEQLPAGVIRSIEFGRE